jgi:hypothetical protein
MRSAARRTRPQRSRGGERNQRAEGDQQEHLGPGAVDAGEEDGDDDDRPELSCDTGPQHGAPERRAEQARVREDRDECSQRGRRKRDPEQPALGFEPGLVPHPAEGQADRERGCPAGRAERKLAAGHALLDHLEPGEEEQEDEPDVGEELDVRVRIGDVEYLGADQDPEHELDDHGRQEEPVVQSRCNRG